MDDMNCPWCGEALTNPFTGKNTTQADYDLSIEAHVEQCVEYEEEQG